MSGIQKIFTRGEGKKEWGSRTDNNEIIWHAIKENAG
jgi:hypothetical protein